MLHTHSYYLSQRISFFSMPLLQSVECIHEKHCLKSLLTTIFKPKTKFQQLLLLFIEFFKDLIKFFLTTNDIAISSEDYAFRCIRISHFSISTLFKIIVIRSLPYLFYFHNTHRTNHRLSCIETMESQCCYFPRHTYNSTGYPHNSWGATLSPLCIFITPCLPSFDITRI